MESVHSNSTELHPFSEEISLWCCVHDAELLAIASDLLDRTLTLSLRVFYINSFHHFAEDTVFRFVMKDVSSVSATRHNPWPGPHDIPAHLPWEEQRELTQQLYAKGRKDSVAWVEVENLSKSAKDAEIMNGRLAVHSAGKCLLTLEVYFLDPDINEYLYLDFAYRELQVLQADEKSMEISDFLALGETYWEAFASRASSESSD